MVIMKGQRSIGLVVLVGVLGVLACVGPVAAQSSGPNTQADTKALFDKIWKSWEANIESTIVQFSREVFHWVLDDEPHILGYKVAQDDHNMTWDHRIFFDIDQSKLTPLLDAANELSDLYSTNYLAPVFAGLHPDTIAKDPYNVFPGAFAHFNDFLNTTYARLKDRLVDFDWGEGAQLVGGGGIGWGIDVMCGQQLIYTMGGGAGNGWTATQHALDGGGGGGGGAQAFRYGCDGNPSGSQIYFDIGGGGGGGAHFHPNETYGHRGETPDDAQFAAGAEQMYTDIMGTMRPCYRKGNLYIKISGGGGMGMQGYREMSSLGNLEFLSYGSGWGFGVVLASPDAQGPIPNPPQKNDPTGTAIAHASVKCRSLCMDQTEEPFYDCYCPCTKSAYAAIPGCTWAAKIRCSEAK